MEPDGVEGGESRVQDERNLYLLRWLLTAVVCVGCAVRIFAGQDTKSLSSFWPGSCFQLLRCLSAGIVWNPGPDWFTTAGAPAGRFGTLTAETVTIHARCTWCGPLALHTARGTASRVPNVPISSASSVAGQEPVHRV